MGDFGVWQNTKLTIAPGTLVLFMGNYSVGILGELVAIGTVQDSIVFTAADTSVGFKGLQFGGTKPCDIQYCQFSYGKGEFGGAVSTAEKSKVTISNSGFYHNSASRGGAIRMSSGGGGTQIQNCDFKWNGASTMGGAIYIFGAESADRPTLIENSIISHNSGGGIYIEDDNSPRFVSNTISHNSGGGFNIQFSNPEIINCLIMKNSNTRGGGFDLAGGEPRIINSTIVANHASYGGGARLQNNAKPTFINSIVALNTAGINGTQFYTESGDVTEINSTLDGGVSFKDADNLDFRLGSANAANGGTPDTTGLGLPATDLDGNPRIKHGRIDKGAYEYQDFVSINGIPGPASAKWNIIRGGSTLFINLSGIDAKSELAIHSLDGALVATLSPNSYTTAWEWEGAKKGVYLLRVKSADGQVYTGRLAIR